MILIALLLAVSDRAPPVETHPVSLASDASPAKAGAQLHAARSWAPAFAGEASFFGLATDKDMPPGSASSTPIDAERAFAADAQTLGQWTAFRKWATADATMFVPQPVNAQEWLKDKKDPPKAIDWWPTASYVSCDGKTAVDPGGWKRPDGSVGYFTTIWQQQADGRWRWALDLGDTTSRALDRPAKPAIRKATCPGPQWSPTPHMHAGPAGSPMIWEADGYSADKSLSWHWIKWSGGPLELTVSLTRKGRPPKAGLAGSAREQVIFDRVTSSK